MSYKNKYKKALETIQEILDSGSDSIKMSRLKLRLQSVFSELKESEDERIRRRIYNYINSTLDDYAPEKEEWLAWLEKQESELKKLEVFAKHGDGMYYLYNNDITYLCGNQTSDIEQDVKETFHVTPPESKESDDKRIIKILQNIVKGACSKYGIKWSGVETSEEDLLAWLEKQGKETSWKPSKEETDALYGIEDDVRRRSTIQVLEYARSLDTYNQYGKADIDKNIAWLEKQGETFTKKDVDDAYLKGVCDAKHELEKQGEETL